MSQKQKAKLKKRAEHQHRNELRKLELFNAALRRAGLSEAFHRILPEVRNGWRGMMLPVPEIVLDASAADCEQARGIQKQMPQFLRIPIAGRGQEVSAVDMVCVLIPLKTCADTLVEYLRRCGDNVETGPGRHVVDFATQMGAFMQRQQNLLLKDFTSMVWMTMVYNTRIDERVFWSKFANRQTPGGKVVPQVVIHKKIPERLKLTVDGVPRSAVRCCVPGGTEGLNEITWKARDIGFLDDPREYPVYMQSHVLEQLERRVPYKHHIYNLAFSLMKPKFHPLSDDRFLVELWHFADKIGYLVGVRLNDCVLLKTFLFLTMQGTPESDLLYRKLRLCRRDIEYMQLDGLAAFLDNDVRQDPVLTKIFDECGCGHLLRIAAKNFSDLSPVGHAETLRKYLGSFHKSASPPPPPTHDPAPADLSSLTLWGQKL